MLRWREQAQTTRFASFGPLVNFFKILFAFFKTTNYLTGILKLLMYLREATMKRTGPNDAFRVVWAISKFLYILFVFFITTDHLTGILKLRVYIREATTKRIYLREATMKRTGPNDAKRVVWAIGKFFFNIIQVFHNYWSSNIYFKATDVPTRCYDEENGPKRRVSRRLGHW